MKAASFIRVFFSAGLQIGRTEKESLEWMKSEEESKSEASSHPCHSRRSEIKRVLIGNLNMLLWLKLTLRFNPDPYITQSRSLNTSHATSRVTDGTQTSQTSFIHRKKRTVSITDVLSSSTLTWHYFLIITSNLKHLEQLNGQRKEERNKCLPQRTPRGRSEMDGLQTLILKSKKLCVTCAPLNKPAVFRSHLC